MRRLWVFVIVLCACSARGQKVLQKTIVDSNVTSIVIDSGDCYQINLQTRESKELEVNASMEGEYSKDLVVHLENKGTSLMVSTGFQPNFVLPNDKLSAHKAVSIALDIVLPEYKSVKIYGTHSNVNVLGNYRSLTVKLSDGDCKLENVGETVDVTTQKGDIWLVTASGLVEATSDYGKVYQSTLPIGDREYRLNSKEGNIYVN